MSLIQFAKNVGRKLGLGDDDNTIQGHGPQQAQHAPPSPLQVQEHHDRRKAAALCKLVQDMGFKVQDLGVRVDGDKITLTGQAPSQEIREKIVLLVGNVEGIGSVDDNMKAAEAAPEAQFYEVRSGDTLSKIAKQYYGDANKYSHIFEANRPMLKDADEIYPGQRLRIPSAAPQRAESFGSHDDFGSYEYCFPAGTRVEMADGSLRAISEISVGDLVRCWNHGQSAIAEGRIEFALSATVDRLVRLNGRLSASPSHRVFTARGYVRFCEIQIGDSLLRSPGTIPEPVTQVEVMYGSFSVFNLVVGTFACFFAEGLLVEDQIGAELTEESARMSLEPLLSVAI